VKELWRLSNDQSTQYESARSGSSARRTRTSKTSKYRSVLTSTHNTIRHSIRRGGINIRKRARRRKRIARWTATEIDTIEQEHQQLVAAYHNEASFQSALNACDDNTTFEEAWSIGKSRFNYMLRFYGGVASVFPGTSQVEKETFVL